jgi:hypothetical protein
MVFGEDGLMQPEPVVTIEGVELSEAQAATVRVALSCFQFELKEPAFVELLGPIGPIYQARLTEIFKIMGL